MSDLLACDDFNLCEKVSIIVKSIGYKTYRICGLCSRYILPQKKVVAWCRSKTITDYKKQLQAKMRKTRSKIGSLSTDNIYPTGFGFHCHSLLNFRDGPATPPE